MRNQTNWEKNILKWGLVMVALGVILAVAGLLLSGKVNGPVFTGKYLPATGIVLLVLGIVSLAQYAYVRRNPKAGRQMMVQEEDERNQLIRARAGLRAYQVSSALAFLVLMWASFAGYAGVPALTGNALWLSLVAVVVIPALIYIANIAYLQNNY